MQKIINNPDDFVDEMLDGILLAHPELRRGSGRRTVVRSNAPIPGKVAIVTGGGSGHLPLFMGYVGDGLADGAAIGNVFASPSAEEILSVTRDVHAGAGVVFLYGNYGGDVMNFELAAELAALEGIEVRSVRAADDVASAPREQRARRRGIAGIFFLYKIAGAAARDGAAIDEVVRVVESAAESLCTAGVALSPCTVPAAGRPTFELPPGEMEIGMGIHGEPGVRRGALESADAIVDQLVELLLADIDARDGDEFDVLVNGLGATPLEELYIMFRRCSARLGDREMVIRRSWIGEYATSLEMAGASISLLRTSPDVARLLDAPASAPLLDR